MNIKDLPQGSFDILEQPKVAPVAEGQLNIKNLPADTFSVVKEPGFVERVGADFAKRRETLANVNAAAKKGEQSPLETIAQHAGQIAGGAFDLAIEGVKSVASVIPERKTIDGKAPKPFSESLLGQGIENFGRGVQKLGNKIGEIPAVQRFAIKDVDPALDPQGRSMVATPESERLERNITALNELLPFVAPQARVGKVTLGAVTRKVEQAALKTGYEAAQKTTSKVVNVPSMMRENAVNKLEQDYLRWTGSTQSGMKRTAKAEVKTGALNRAGTEGLTPARVLAEDKIIPKTSGTKFDTFDQAKKYREGLQPLHEANDKALQHIKEQTPPVQVSELESRTVSQIDDLKIPEGDKVAMKKAATDEYALLKEKYPEGVTIDKLNTDIKQVYSKDVPWDAPRVDKILGDVNYQIRKAAQKSIEETASKAGFDDVAQFNRVIGDHLEAAKFLEKLHGQTIKGGRLGKYVGGAVLGIAGGVSHGFGGALAGYIGGDMIANMLIKASVANPVKRMILASIQQKSPAVYEKIMKWIEDQSAAKAGRLALPSGAKTEAPSFTGNVPIDSRGNFPKTTTPNFVALGGKTPAKSEMVVTGGKRAPANFSEAKARATGQKPFGSLFEFNESVKASQPKTPPRGKQGVTEGASITRYSERPAPISRETPKPKTEKQSNPVRRYTK